MMAMTDRKIVILRMPVGDALDKAIAEQVMGWRLLDRVELGWGNGPPVYSAGEDPNDPLSNPTRQNFHPSTAISDAWMVVKKMSERGYWFQGRHGWRDKDDECFAGFTPHGPTGWNGTPDNWTPAATMQHAICLAALLAINESY